MICIFDPNELLKLLTEMFALQARAQGIKLETSTFLISRNNSSCQLLSLAGTGGQSLRERVAGKLPFLRGDKTRLRQVLINLVKNALKFTPCGSINIEMAFQADAKKLYVDVLDSGLGIERADQEKLFQMFSKL